MPFSRTLPVRSPGWFSGSSSEAAKRAASSSTGPASSAASPLSPPTASRTRRISASGAAYGMTALLQARQHSRSPPAAAPRYAGVMASITIALGAAAALILLAFGARGQPVPDCRQAKTAAEKAICGNVELAAADKAMADSYTALRAKLPPEQQKALLADQRRWITRRTAACGDKTEEALAQCLLAETEARRRFFAGESPNAAAGVPRTVPALFHEIRKGRYEISIEYPRVLTPRSAAATAFERTARAIAFGKDAVKEYREMERPMAAGAKNYYGATYETTYLDPRLVSLVFTISIFTGGAHP